MKIKYLLFFVLFFVVFGDWIANEKPIYVRFDGNTYFPLFEVPFVKLGWKKWPNEFQSGSWREINFERKISTLIPYSPETIDRKNLGFRSPFAKQKLDNTFERHWMGTDRIGRDVLSGWIRGFRMATIIGFLSVLLAGLVGIGLGGMAGYFGNDRINPSLFKLLLGAIWILGLFYWLKLGFQTDWKNEAVFYWLIIWIIAGIIVYSIKIGGIRVPFPMDWLIGLAIQAIDAIPALFFLLALLPLFNNPGIFDVVFLIALIRWTGIARLTRAEFLRIRDLAYIQSAKLLGISNFNIGWKHILPNAIGSLWVTFAYSFAGAILLEAYLGFLGIGMPPGTISWGSQMQQVRENPTAWWLAVFPGFAIFLILFGLQKLGEKLASKSY